MIRDSNEKNRYPESRLQGNLDKSAGSEESSLKSLTETGQSIEIRKGRSGRVTFKTERIAQSKKNSIYLKFLVMQYFIGGISLRIKHVKSLYNPAAILIIL